MPNSEILLRPGPPTNALSNWSLKMAADTSTWAMPAERSAYLKRAESIEHVVSSFWNETRTKKWLVASDQ